MYTAIILNGFVAGCKTEAQKIQDFFWQKISKKQFDKQESRGIMSVGYSRDICYANQLNRKAFAPWLAICNICAISTKGFYYGRSHVEIILALGRRTS